jgi:hypothetical protein
MTPHRFSGKFLGLLSPDGRRKRTKKRNCPHWPASSACRGTATCKCEIARNCANSTADSSTLNQAAPWQSSRAVTSSKTFRQRSDCCPSYPAAASTASFSADTIARFAAGTPSSACCGSSCAKPPSFWTEKRDGTRSTYAGAALQATPDGPDEEDATAYCHAANCAPEHLNRTGATGAKHNARCNPNADLLGAARHFRHHFDYSDLDLPFLKPWTIPPQSNSMNPILTAK